MRNNVYTPSLAGSKPSSAQSRDRRNMSSTPMTSNRNPIATSIDLLESDMVLLQQQKKQNLEDFLIKPPSALRQKRINAQSQNSSLLQDAYDIQPPLKSNRPQTQSTNNNNIRIPNPITSLKGNDLQPNPTILDQTNNNTGKNQQQFQKINKQNGTATSFYTPDNGQGLSPTKLKLLDNVGKQNFVDYPNKIEGNTPKIWHARMDDFENKGNEWQMNLNHYKQEDIQQKQDKQKQIHDHQRQAFLNKFSKNLDLDMKIKKNTLQKIQPPNSSNLNGSLNNNTIQNQNQKQLIDKDQWILFNNQTELIKDTQPIKNNSNNNQIISLGATVSNFQRYPRQNTPKQPRSSYRQNGGQSLIEEDLDTSQNKQPNWRKRVLSTDGYEIQYDYNLRPIGQKGMFVYEGFKNEDKTNKRREDNLSSVKNTQGFSQNNNNVCKIGSLLKNQQSASLETRCIYPIGEYTSINQEKQRMADTVNSQMYLQQNTQNKINSQPNTSRTEKRPFTAAVMQNQGINNLKNKSSNGSRNSPSNKDNFIGDSAYVKQNSLPQNLSSNTQSFSYSNNPNELVLNSTDINIIDELDKFDEKMKENQKMQKIMSKMRHQSKGFCGVTKKENEMLVTVEGFKKVRAKKAQPSYPYCLSFDPF